jgi:hypothetical protein
VRPATRDYLWGAFAVLFAALTALDAVGGLVVVIASFGRTHFARGTVALLLLPFTLAGTYWFAAGGWRRTTWGRREERAEAAPISAAQATRLVRYSIAGGVCVLALAIALSVQILSA